MLYYPVVTEHAGPPVLGAFAPWRCRLLFTAYPFVTGEKPVSLLVHLLKTFGNLPMLCDSGLFTLRSLFKGTLKDSDLIDYTKRYVRLIRSVRYTQPLIEMDVHHIMQRDDTLQRCRDMFDPIADQTLYVYRGSTEEADVFVRMVREHRRIALAYGELTDFHSEGRKMWSGTPFPKLHHPFHLGPKRVLRWLTTQAGDALHGTHIHLLGHTEEWLASFPDNFSCDSASWSAFMYWGATLTGTPWEVTYRDKQFHATNGVMREVLKHTPAMIREYKASPEHKGTDVRVKYTQMLAAGLRSSLLWWESLRKKYRGDGDGPFDPADWGVKHGEEKEEEKVPSRKRKGKRGRNLSRRNKGRADRPRAS